MDANIQKYQAFVEVADAGSFTKAAETLAYSQSGISHMVSDLERDWGVALFERSRRGVVLTGDGARLLPEARALCESFRALEATVDEVRGLETGLIRIGVFPSVAAHWIPRIIKRFSADYPGIDYKLRVGDYTEIEEWIADGTVDCGFVLLPLRTDARLIARALEEDEFLAVLPRDHELAGSGVFPVERLAEFPLLSPASESDDELLEFLIRWGVRPTTRLTSWDDRAILSMVEYGMGVSVLSRLMLRGLSPKRGHAALVRSGLPHHRRGLSQRRPPSPGHPPLPRLLGVSQRRGVSGGGLSELECRRNADGLPSELSRGQSVLFLVRCGRLRYYGSSSESWAQWRPTSFP